MNVMDIEFQGAKNQDHAQIIERILLDALRNEEVNARPAFNNDESIKAIDPDTATLIVDVLNSNVAALLVKALFVAIPMVYNDIKNKDVKFNLHGYKFDYYDYIAGKLDGIKTYISSLGLYPSGNVIRHALLIAVSGSLSDKSVPKLEFAHSDIERIRDVLATNGPECQFEISAIIDPKCADMKEKIHALFAERSPGEEVLFFYSGHGIKTNSGTFICANDTQLSRLELDGLRLEDIGRYASTTQASQALVVLDCCYSGGASEYIFSEMAPRSAHKSFHLLSSTSANKVAKESKKKKSGIFTYYFVEGVVSGKAAASDGTITVSNIHSYISQRVRQEERNVEPPQYNIKNKTTEFFIRKKAKPFNETFQDVRSFVLSLNEKKLLPLSDVSKILKNCFADPDSPRTFEERFVQNVLDFKNHKINFKEFSRFQRLSTAKSSRTWLWVLIIVGAGILIMLLNAN